MKKSILQLAEFYSGGKLVDKPWRGTTRHSGPEYLDIASLAQVAAQGHKGESASPYRREIGIGEVAIRVTRKAIGSGEIDNE